MLRHLLHYEFVKGDAQVNDAKKSNNDKIKHATNFTEPIAPFLSLLHAFLCPFLFSFFSPFLFPFLSNFHCTPESRKARRDPK